LRLAGDLINAGGFPCDLAVLAKSESHLRLRHDGRRINVWPPPTGSTKY